MNRIPKWASKTSYNSPAPQPYQDTHISSPRHKSPQNNDLWSSCLSLSLECDTCNYRTSSTPDLVCVSFSPCLARRRKSCPDGRFACPVVMGYNCIALSGLCGWTRAICTRSWWGLSEQGVSRFCGSGRIVRFRW